MSTFKLQPVPLSVKGKKFAIVASRFNNDLCEELIAGATETLAAHGVTPDSVTIHRCPGAFEIPMLAFKVIDETEVDAVICLGAVVKGDTPHFDFVAGSCASGIMQVAIETGIPVIFGVLTTNNDEQAWERADRKRMNKGGESALTAMEMADSFSKLERK
ncbi:MAG: 6,7-dimethyl-8-ribityllumazine synthase [Bacteroidetes bacterium]|nr:6,7-dimethyl-8-ribityllumazine synthase [Bacteroidota bacterium]